MCSRDGFNIFERSTRENSGCKPEPESSVNPVSPVCARLNTGRNVLTRPTVVSNPPVDESRTGSNDPSTKLLSSSYPQYSAVGVTVPANGQSIGPEEIQEQVVDEYRATSCNAFLDWYTNTVIDFRNSKLIHIIHLMVSHIPISAIIMGFLYTGDCPQTSYLPDFITAVGLFGVLFISLWITLSCCEYHGTPCSKLQKCALGIILMVLLISVVVEMYFVCHLSPSFDPSAHNYCSKSFYYYLVYREVATAGALTIAAMVYIPGSSLYNWCRQLPAPSPAGAFFHSL